MGQAKNRKSEILKLKNNNKYNDIQINFDRIDGFKFEADSIKQMKKFYKEIDSLIKYSKNTGDVDILYEYICIHINSTNNSIMSEMDKIAKKGDAPPIACKAGCSHCCTTWVSVSGLEVIYITKKIESKREDFIRKIQMKSPALGKSFDERDRIVDMCIFNSNNQCSIYEHRPKSCRLAASCNAEICEKSYNHIQPGLEIPIPIFSIKARQKYNFPIILSLKNNKIDNNSYNLIDALNVTLHTKNYEKRWLSGEAIFASIPKDPHRVENEIEAMKFLP